MNGNDSEIKIKTEPTLNAGRLISFKAPRDLTLGANKPANKKVFVPNLNAVRNKNKSNASNSEVSKERRRDGKSENNAIRGHRGHGVGGDRQKPTILKAGGVFSEGVAASARQSSFRGYSGGRDSKDEPVLQKPTIKPKEALKLDKNMEVMQIKELTNDEEEADLIAEQFAPTRLPISNYSALLHNTKDIKPIKLEVNIKSEPMDENQMKTSVEPPPELKPDKKIKMEYGLPTNPHHLFQTPTPTLILLQFPDSLPGRGPEEDESASSANPSETQPSIIDEKPKTNPCSAKHLQEGQIGKIQIFKSGKIQMLIGNTTYDMSLGSQTCFRQDAMAVSVDSEQRSGSVINLGTMQNKITITPSWETMFQRMETN